MSAKTKLRAISALCLYPMVSTFLMTLIWQIFGTSVEPFLGGYYFKWVFLYTEHNPDWLEAEYLFTTRVLYFVYIAAYLLLAILTLLILFRRRGKAISIWILCSLWIADGVWIVLDMINTVTSWQPWVRLAEHFVFIALAVLGSFVYLQVKKENPQWFRKKRKQIAYRNRF